MKMLELLKSELLGKELTVLEMDNIASSILEVGGQQSILNGDFIYYAFENMNHTYTTWENGNEVEYNISFNLIEENEYKQDIIIKITDIEIL